MVAESIPSKTAKIIQFPAFMVALGSGYERHSRIGGWLPMGRRSETEARLDAIRRPRDTPIWGLEAALNCRSCRTPRYSPLVRMIKFTQQRELTPYVWVVHPDDDDRR
jgi:hypothetical protein